jgi:hypothetical protein
MDDDDVPETGLAGGAPSTTNPSGETAPPAKPPRPLSPQQQAENTLKEAFPSIDAAIVKAVLIASGGRVEPAFNALLGKVFKLSFVSILSLYNVHCLTLFKACPIPTLW